MFFNHLFYRNSPGSIIQFQNDDSLSYIVVWSDKAAISKTYFSKMLNKVPADLAKKIVIGCL